MMHIVCMYKWCRACWYL